jgi:hypothetical protein
MPLTSGAIKIVTKNLTIEGHGAGDTIIRPQMDEPMFEVFKSTVAFSGVSAAPAVDADVVVVLGPGAQDKHLGRRLLQ